MFHQVIWPLNSVELPIKTSLHVDRRVVATVTFVSQPFDGNGLIVDTVEIPPPSFVSFTGVLSAGCPGVGDDVSNLNPGAWRQRTTQLVCQRIRIVNQS